MRNRTIGFLRKLAALLAVVSMSPLQAEATPEDFIFTQRGTLPIILTAPHGGQLKIPGLPSRREQCEKNRYDYIVCGRDEYTEEIAMGLMVRLEDLLGRKPYVVIARFHREFIDANRKETNAFNSPTAKPYYRAYHDSIRTFIAEVREKHSGHGILIDVHGRCRSPKRSEDPETIYRGTGEGVGISRLLRRHGLQALTGPSSIFGKLKDSGYSVAPALTAPTNAEKILQGGHTIYAYGSHTPNGIDAIQVEVGWNIRKDSSRREKFTEELADAIAVFYKAYVRR